MKAVLYHETGGPEVLQYVDVDDPEPGAADVVVDVCGYRRNGHNEQDDPSLTLPLVQRCIDNQPGVQEVYTAQLLQEGVVAQAHLDRWERKLTAEYEAGAARPWCLLAPSLFSYGVCPLVFAI